MEFMGMSKIVGRDYWKTVPGWCAFAEMYSRAIASVVEDRPHKFVEIGSWQGKSACLMAQLIRDSGKDVSFTCVDPWDDGGPDLHATEYYKQLPKPLRDCFNEFTAPYSDIIKPIQEFSVPAARHFEDASLDFLMIDGDHTYEGVRGDIDAYLPKMRPGSIMAGDDYLWPGVKQAASETFGSRLRPVIKGNNKNYLNSVAYWWVQL
jgi:predicted O-methyltransferase YrrM